MATHSIDTSHAPAGPAKRLRRAAALAVTVGAFAGLAGLSAPVAGAQPFQVGGAIAVEYSAAAAAANQSPEEFFGAPTTAELHAANGGRWQDFANNQAIYWHPRVSEGRANQIGGDIRRTWGATSRAGGQGWEHGPLGYPTTREWASRESSVSRVVARGNHFQGGTIYQVPGRSTYVVWGNIRASWWGLGAESSRLGLPAGNETVTPTGWRQQFEGGTIDANRNGNVSVNLDEAGAPPATPTPGDDLVEQLGGSLADLVSQLTEGMS